MRGSSDFKTERARLLRQNSTNAELRLWYRLRSRSINGHKFVRQEPIGPYIVDFICREKRLIVEVDGVTHSEPAEIKRDKARTEILEACGFLVVRISNTDVYENLEGVLEMIETSLRFE